LAQRIDIFTDKERYERKLSHLVRKGYFLADLHVHTTRSDGIASPQKVIANAAKKGIHVAISDHNKAVDFGALTNNEKKRVIPAIEARTSEGVDILAFFYKAEELEKFYRTKIMPRKITPCETSIPLKGLISMLSVEKCLICIPHCTTPNSVRRKNFVKTYKLLGKDLLKKINLFEAFNSASNKTINHEAVRMAKKLGKPIAVGSDAHTPKAIGNAINYCKASSTNEFLNQLAKGKTAMIAIRTPYIQARVLPLGMFAWMKIKGILGLKN